MLRSVLACAAVAVTLACTPPSVRNRVGPATPWHSVSDATAGKDPAADRYACHTVALQNAALRASAAQQSLRSEESLRAWYYDDEMRTCMGLRGWAPTLPG